MEGLNIMIIESLLDEIAKHGDIKKKHWWENYVKHNSLFYGVPMEKLKIILDLWVRENEIETISQNNKIELVKKLFAKEFSEEKLLGVLFIQKYLVKNIPPEIILEVIADIYQKGYIFDWNISDWLSVKVLTLLIDEYKNIVADKIIDWHKDDNLWMARTSLVAFAQTKDLKAYLPILNFPARILIERKERFAKTSVGWLLREISKFDFKYVEQFLIDEAKYLLPEVVNNALKNVDQEKKHQIKKYLKTI